MKIASKTTAANDVSHSKREKSKDYKKHIFCHFSFEFLKDCRDGEDPVGMYLHRNQRIFEKSIKGYHRSEERKTRTKVSFVKGDRENKL